MKTIVAKLVVAFAMWMPGQYRIASTLFEKVHRKSHEISIKYIAFITLRKCLPAFGLFLPFWSTDVFAAEVLLNPREVMVAPLIRGQSPTLVIADDVNVRISPTTFGMPGTVFAQLERGDEVYVLSCEGYDSGHFWVKVWIPEIGEIGHVVTEYLQNNYQFICDYTRPR